MTRVFSDHFCLLVFAQDGWREKDKSQILKKILEDYIRSSVNSDCDLCMTCPVCRGLWDLFDPTNPGKYVSVRQVCKDVFSVFKTKLGNNLGIILFGHTRLSTVELREFVQLILNNERIKKISILQLESFKVGKKIIDTIESIKHCKIKISGFNQILKKRKYDFRVLYEVSKDSYY